MKTEQEQIEKIMCMFNKLRRGDYCVNNCYGCCGCCGNEKIDITCHDVVVNFIQALMQAGYGDVSEYKAEIEDLKDEIIYLERKVAIRDNALKDRDRAIEMLEGKQDTIVNQAKIDVLKELKKRARTSYVLDDFILGSVVFSKDIDELIKEVEEQ